MYNDRRHICVYSHLENTLTVLSRIQSAVDVDTATFEAVYCELITKEDQIPTYLSTCFLNWFNNSLSCYANCMLYSKPRPSYLDLHHCTEVVTVHPLTVDTLEPTQYNFAQFINVIKTDLQADINIDVYMY